MDISIVVVTWNAKQFVDECFGSIREQSQGLSAEIIVVDNASNDGTPDMIADRYPEVKLIRSKENLGFARGNNLAIKASRGKYVCLVNPDVRVLPGCFRSLMEYMDQNPSIGMSGPRVLRPNGQLQHSYMRAPSVWNSWCRALALDRSPLRNLPLFGGLMMADFHGDRTRDVDVLNGCFWLIRRTAMDQVGLIDERYFMYGDDIDWCYRFRKAGWSVVYFVGAESIHYGGGVTAAKPVYFHVEMHKSNLRYWKKYHSRPAQIGYLASLWTLNLTRYVIYSIFSLFGNNWRTRVGVKAKGSLATMQWLVRTKGGRSESTPISEKPDEAY